MAKKKRRTYREEERLAVLADVSKLGVRGAARAHGVPSKTVEKWVQKAREQAAERAAASAQDAASAADTASAECAPNAAEGDAGVKPARAPNKPRKVARRYSPSEKARALEYAAEHGVSAAADALGMSRYSLQAWRRQVERASKGDGPSPTSGPAPDELAAQRDREILAEWHKHPGLGPSQIRNQLRRRGIKVSVNTTREVMIEAGYRPPKVKREPHDNRYEAVRPNHMWHLDFVHRYVNRQKTFTLILLDDYSRFVTGHGVDDAERADLVIEAFERAVQQHGRPEMIMHDKGSAFWSWRGISRFTALLTELGIDQIVAKQKEWNGKIEVFNGNIQKELFDVHRFYDMAEMRRRLQAHLHWYNHQRTHHALGGLLVPADRYYGRVDEVMARIEAGVGREGLDGLQLAARCLELFKVVSRGGKPELWLMGHKLFGDRA